MHIVLDNSGINVPPSLFHNYHDYYDWYYSSSSRLVSPSIPRPGNHQQPFQTSPSSRNSTPSSSSSMARCECDQRYPKLVLQQQPVTAAPGSHCVVLSLFLVWSLCAASVQFISVKFYFSLPLLQTTVLKPKPRVENRKFTAASFPV